MKRNILTAILGSLLAATAFAGRQNPVTVQIIDTWDPVYENGRSATGTLGGTYNSPNNVEYVGCSLHTVAAGNYARCYARNAANLYRTCFTWDPAQIDIIREIRSDSQIYFQWNEDGSCRRVWVAQRAENPPKR